MYHERGIKKYFLSKKNPHCSSPSSFTHAGIKLTPSLPCLISVLWPKNLGGCDSKRKGASWVSNQETYFETLPETIPSWRSSHFFWVATASILIELFKSLTCPVTLGGNPLLPICLWPAHKESPRFLTIIVAGYTYNSQDADGRGSQTVATI